MMNFVFAGLVIAAYLMGMMVGRWIGKNAQAKTFEPTQETWLELEKYKWVTPSAYAVHDFEMEMRAAEDAETNPEAGSDCTDADEKCAEAEEVAELDLTAAPPMEEIIRQDPEAGRQEMTVVKSEDDEVPIFVFSDGKYTEVGVSTGAGRQNPKPRGKRRKKGAAFPHRDELTDLELIAFDKAMIHGAFDPEAGADCWEWPGAMNGSTPQETITIQGHRIRTSVAWLFYCAANGRTEVRTMEHVCGNKKCVNPAHLKIWVPVAPGERKKTGGGV